MDTSPPAATPVTGMPGLGRAVLLSLVLGLVAVPLAALTSGADGARGAAFGALAVVAFFAFGAGTTYVAAAYAPAVSLLVALLTYTLQVVALGVALLALAGSGLVEGEDGRAWLAGTVIAGTFLWVATLIRSATTARIPLYTSDPSPVKPGNGVASGGEVQGR